MHTNTRTIAQLIGDAALYASDAQNAANIAREHAAKVDSLLPHPQTTALRTYVDAVHVNAAESQAYADRALVYAEHDDTQGAAGALASAQSRSDEASQWFDLVLVSLTPRSKTSDNR